jgi:hypothetical protein
MSECLDYRLHDLRRFGILYILEERTLFTTKLTNPAIEAGSAITMTTVKFILAIMATGAVVSSVAFVAERMSLSKQKGYSMKAHEFNFLP